MAWLFIWCKTTVLCLLLTTDKVENVWQPRIDIAPRYQIDGFFMAVEQTKVELVHLLAVILLGLPW